MPKWNLVHETKKTQSDFHHHILFLCRVLFGAISMLINGEWHYRRTRADIKWIADHLAPTFFSFDRLHRSNGHQTPNRLARRLIVVRFWLSDVSSRVSVQPLHDIKLKMPEFMDCPDSSDCCHSEHISNTQTHSHTKWISIWQKKVEERKRRGKKAPPRTIASKTCRV